MTTPACIIAFICVCFLQAGYNLYSFANGGAWVPLDKNLLFHSSPDSLKKQWKPEIPVLCYHQIGAPIKKEKGYQAALTVNATAFEQQMKMLYDSGYRTILPDQLFDYLTGKIVFTFKPVMITFDDGTEGQFNYALKTLDKYKFKAVFFIMTVSLGKAGYLSHAELQTLSKQGHIIGNHTWDHHNVKAYKQTDWKKQLDDPAKTLAAITGKPVIYFSYPYGAYSQQAISELKHREYKLAFILDTNKDQKEPLFTVRRIMANSSWTPSSLLKMMQRNFH